ncbi:MAG: DNA-processing protein DprA [Myxococcota bacterium]
MPRDPDVLDPADPSVVVPGLLRDWLDLQRNLFLRPGVAVELLRRHSCPRRALRAYPRAIPSTRGELDAAVAALARDGVVAVPFGSPPYPSALESLEDAAPLLLVRGEVSALAAPSVAMVGSRAASAYGRSVARRLATEFAEAGLVVVSGLALGIDAIAHTAALDAGGRTVAVQACGPDRVYPSAHRSLARRIAGQGAIVSEFPPGTAPLPYYFPLRNRLISGLASAVVVVEARERSGSLITAQHAADQGRDVFAVPGPISAPTSAGPNRLLRDGAGVVLSAEDVLGEFRRSGELPSHPRRASNSPEPDRPGLTGERHRIVRGLLREPATRDQLARRLDLAPEKLALDLLELELEGRIAEDRDGRLRVVRE